MDRLYKAADKGKIFVTPFHSGNHAPGSPGFVGDCSYAFSVCPNTYGKRRAKYSVRTRTKNARHRWYSLCEECYQRFRKNKRF